MTTWLVFAMFVFHILGLWITGRRLRGYEEAFKKWHYLVILAALVCHSFYWIWQIQAMMDKSQIPTTWFLWANLGSWCAVAGLFIKLHKQKYLLFNYFVVPIAMSIFMIGYQQQTIGVVHLPEETNFFRVFWRWVHSGSLLVGTLIMIISFSAGILYLLQSVRLKGKQKRIPFRLPSLEKLCSLGEQGMLATFLAFSLGLISGIVMNMTIGEGNPVVDWNQPLVWSSGVLLVWITAATLFSFFYQPARYGRKVAYLSITSGVMIAIEILLVVFSGHGKTEPSTPGPKLEIVRPQSNQKKEIQKPGGTKGGPSLEKRSEVTQ